MADEVTENNVISWVEECVVNGNFSDHTIQLLGNPGKGAGYIGVIVLATVSGTTNDKTKRELNLVVKHGKPNPTLRKVLPIRFAFETEIIFYDRLIPEFTKLQKENNVQEIFDAVPKYYGSTISNEIEAIILEDLCKKGFQLSNKKLTLNIDHLKAVLQEYGKFHALSFALKDKKPNVFKDVTKLPDMGKIYFEDQVLKDSWNRAINEALEIFEERKNFSLIEKVKKLIYKNAGDIIYDLLTEENVSESVFTHGDCWSNNFMYQYEGNNLTSPSRTMIIDWQMSGVRSPVFDLSHFIYANCAKQELDNFEELLEYYHASFSSFLLKLGCDPEKLFPYSVLKQHWRRWSLYGVLYLPLILKVLLCDEEDTPELGDIQEGQTVEESMEIGIKDKDSFYNRVKSAFEHYFEFQFKK